MHQMFLKYHFFENGLQFKYHPVHGASCAVDSLMEVFHYGIYLHVTCWDLYNTNLLVSQLVNVSHMRQLYYPSCEMREGIWN